MIRNMFSYLGFCVFLWLGTIPVFSNEPLSPAQSMTRMTLPEGYKVELFISEPAIKNVIDWTWDHKGRLWVTETTDYPHIIRTNPVEGGQDQIKIFEDQDGDGKADKATIFASGLNIPVGIAPTEKGVVVAVSGGIYLLEDLNGDDQADKTTLLYGGFTTWDTHTQHNSIRYGLDNYLWASRGIDNNHYTSIFKFKMGDNSPQDVTRKNEIANIWGIGFDEYGNLFSARPNGAPNKANATGGADRLIQTVIPKKYYDKIPTDWRGNSKIGNHDLVSVAPNMDIWRSGLRTSSSQEVMSATMSSEVYTARLFDEEYHNKAVFVCDPGLRVVHQEFLVPYKSRYFTKKGNTNNLITSSDPWSGFVRAAPGPDGSVWVMDLYNTNIGHNENLPGYNGSGPGRASNIPRDKERGRIYRVTPKNPRTTDPIPDLNPENLDQLVETLRHDNRFWRLTAQRLLVYKQNQKQEIVEKLLSTLEFDNRAGESENAGTVHALWTLEGLGAVQENADTLYSLLKHPSDAVVMNLVQILPKTKATVEAIRDAKVLEDTNPHVILKTLLALSEMPGSAVSGVTLSIRTSDKNLDTHMQDAFAIAQSTGLSIGTTNNGGNRISNLNLKTAPPLNIQEKKYVVQTAPILYATSDIITGKAFKKTDRGTISFYSTQGKLLGTRTLNNQQFVEGPLALSSTISFYHLSNESTQSNGKVINVH